MEAQLLEPLTRTQEKIAAFFKANPFASVHAFRKVGKTTVLVRQVMDDVAGLEEKRHAPMSGEVTEDVAIVLVARNIPETIHIKDMLRKLAGRNPDGTPAIDAKLRAPSGFVRGGTAFRLFVSSSAESFSEICRLWGSDQMWIYIDEASFVRIDVLRAVCKVAIEPRDAQPKITKLRAISTPHGFFPESMDKLVEWKLEDVARANVCSSDPLKTESELTEENRVRNAMRWLGERAAYAFIGQFFVSHHRPPPLFTYEK